MRKSNIVLILVALGIMVIAGCITPAEIGQTANDSYPVQEINITKPANTTADSDKALEPIKPREDIKIPDNAVVIEGTEGDLIQLKPQAVDPDKGDVVFYYFTKPFNENGKWQTKEGDAGKYLVTITASDGKANSSQDVVVVVHPAKKAPVIECSPEITVKEGELIDLNCNIYDPEGDSVVVEYSGFMKKETYQTTYDDAGDYTAVVKAKNKYKEAQKTIKIRVLNVNRAPEISGLSETVSGMEDDLITLKPAVMDPDKEDSVTITYSQPFNSNGVWQTKVGDAGSYKTTIVATDSKATTKKEITVEVRMKNTAPVLKKINDIEVYEGETIKIPVDVYDREGDKVSILVTGWMNSLSYTTSYEDAGVYSVTVTAKDSEFEAKQTFKVTVLEKNRGPVFKVPA